MAAALSWRLLFIAGALVVIGLLLGYVWVVTFPVAIALLLSALFAPLVVRLVRVTDGECPALVTDRTVRVTRR
jgi:predicted PurR-regulated permease PerM